MIVIENNLLSIAISPQGGILQSIRSKETGIEYLWQGDRTYWGGRAPNLFPFVGRLFQSEYTYNGMHYSMGLHGFLNRQVLTPKQTLPDRFVFHFTDTPETFRIYPFHFHLQLEYSLHQNHLHIRYQVNNLGENTMYCGFGGHPGINLPLEPGLCFEDYQITFPQECHCNVVQFSPSVLTLGKKPYFLEFNRYLPLNHDLFLQDAIVLTDCPRQVTLSSKKGNHGVTVHFPAMPYIGFWQIPNKNAPYLCIEPWSVLPGREGIVEDISTMPDMTKISPGKHAVNMWSIEIF